MGTPLIQLEDVKKVFHTDEVETHAVADVHLTIDRGEYVCIEGPSGSGKTTLLSLIGLLDSPSSGVYKLDGKQVSSLANRERARVRNAQIGFIFQSFNLIGDLTVWENVELPLTYRPMSAAERKASVDAALEKVGMAHRARHPPPSPEPFWPRTARRSCDGVFPCCFQCARTGACLSWPGLLPWPPFPPPPPIFRWRMRARPSSLPASANNPPPPSPWMARAPINTKMFGDSAASTEPAVPMIVTMSGVSPILSAPFATGVLSFAYAARVIR